jgi:hypothetical protein
MDSNQIPEKIFQKELKIRKNTWNQKCNPWMEWNVLGKSCLIDNDISTIPTMQEDTHPQEITTEQVSKYEKRLSKLYTYCTIMYTCYTLISTTI